MDSSSIGALAAQTFRARKVVLITAAVLVALGVIVSHIFYLPKYTATTQVSVLNESSILLEKFMSKANGTSSEIDAKSTNYIQILHTDDFYTVAARKLIASEQFDNLKIVAPREMSIYGRMF